MYGWARHGARGYRSQHAREAAASCTLWLQVRRGEGALDSAKVQVWLSAFGPVNSVRRHASGRGFLVEMDTAAAARNAVRFYAGAPPGPVSVAAVEPRPRNAARPAPRRDFEAALADVIADEDAWETGTDGAFEPAALPASFAALKWYPGLHARAAHIWASHVPHRQWTTLLQVFCFCRGCLLGTRYFFFPLRNA